ncbi:MAG: hypothetical protein M1826_000311 [Phylliscum demangeonii]|nr:MAG: hypothetical protein M1826_000311 [Phylliscum demangeonii]
MADISPAVVAPEADQADPLTSMATTDGLLVSASEQQLLELYDRYEQLTIETALLKAEEDLRTDDASLPTSPKDMEEQIRAAEQQALHAKAAYSIRAKVIEHVLIANPILDAIHAGAIASAGQRRLGPLITRRDELSIAHSQASTDLASTRVALAAAEVETIKINTRNAQLASTVSSLADSLKEQGEAMTRDVRVRARLKKAREDARTSRLKWRVMKSVVSATVAGSGVNWAEDELLRELVLDDEEEEEEEEDDWP